ncbi:MAG TPA: phage portal protein [Pseudonocardiaceae bacterium]|nr:phage portal protein [Pseudonocardiaceae bacterium]
MIVTNGEARRAAREARSGLMGAQPQGWGWNDPAAIPPPGMYSMQRAGVPVTTKTALQVDSVFTALRVISNAIIKMGDPRAYEVALDRDNQPYQKWLAEQPGILTATFGPMFQFDGQSRTVISLALFGEAFWYVLDRDKLQYPTALEVLNPALVDIRRDGSIWYGTGVDRHELDWENVIQVPFMAMPGATRGLNSIEYAGVAYALALAAMEYGQRWFSQGASPSYILSTDQKLGTPEVKRIAEKFLIEHSGLQAAHLPLVVDSGLKVQKTQSTPDEAQYLNTLQYARECVAAWFGLPPHLVGGTDKGNMWGGTVEEQGIQMVDFSLSGYVVRLNEAYSKLLPKGTLAALDEERMIRASGADLAKQIQMLRLTGVETKNEIRVQKLGKRPLPGGDELTDPLNSNTSPAVGMVFAEEVADDIGEPAPAVQPPSQTAA